MGEYEYMVEQQRREAARQRKARALKKDEDEPQPGVGCESRLAALDARIAEVEHHQGLWLENGWKDFAALDGAELRGLRFARSLFAQQGS